MTLALLDAVRAMARTAMDRMIAADDARTSAIIG
mgnify:CR=1 FL=1